MGKPPGYGLRPESSTRDAERLAGGGYALSDKVRHFKKESCPEHGINPANSIAGLIALDQSISRAVLLVQVINVEV
jgi:hypothetical protein